jgi:hypothetical protein
MNTKIKPKYSTSYPPGAAKKRDSSSWVGRVLYDGKELRPYQGRPGAMDAFALPSRGFRT